MDLLKHLKKICMKNILWSLLLIVLSSCIEISQEIHLKKDGSGKAIYTLNITKIKEMMELLETFDVNDKKDNKNKSETSFNDLEKQLVENSESLQKIEGISKLKFTSKNFIYKISFQFKHVSALNKALTILNSGKEGFEKGVIEYIKIDNKQITVKNYNQIGNLKDSQKPMEDGQKEQEMGDVIISEEKNVDTFDFDKGDWMNGLFMDATYTTIVQVYNNILSSSHPQAQVKGKTVILKLPILDLDKPENLQNIITLK